jgi:hypothetical protein
MTKKIENGLSVKALTVVQPNDDLESRALLNQEQIDTDVNVARENIHNALEIAKQTIDDIALLAKQSQHPKAFDSLSNALSTYTNIATELINVQMKKQKLQPKNDFKEESGNVTNNNIFVGSTAELQEMIENLKKEREND